MARSRNRPPRKATEAGGKVVSKVLKNTDAFRTGKGPVKWKKDKFETGLQSTRAKRDYPESEKWPPHPQKTDDQLRDDAKYLHEGIEENNRKFYTVATMQDKDGRLYYTVSGNSTHDTVRERAEELGYRRLSGGAIKGPDQHHAEQLAKNAFDTGVMEPPVRVAPSRQPCDDLRPPDDPKNQKCRETLAGVSDLNLVGWP
jgi:hypothetical protein